MYSVTDLTELIRHHLALSTDDTEQADVNLVQLMRNIEQMITTSRWHAPITWMVCEDCGAWVSSELFGPDGAGECEDGGFRCTECRFAGEEFWQVLAIQRQPYHPGNTSLGYLA